MGIHTSHEVDRLYRSLLDRGADLWLTQPSYSDLPRERRPVDELPADVTEHMCRLEALERLTQTQRTAYKVVVMGLIRTWRDGRWQDTRIRPMNHREAAEYLDISEHAVASSLRRARARLAVILSDEDREAA